MRFSRALSLSAACLLLAQALPLSAGASDRFLRQLSFSSDKCREGSTSFPRLLLAEAQGAKASSQNLGASGTSASPGSSGSQQKRTPLNGANPASATTASPSTGSGGNVSSGAAGPAGGDDMEYTIHGKPASKQQYQAAMLVDEAILLLRSNANEQALQKLKQAVALYEGLAEAHHALGVVYTKQNKFDEALKELRRSLELNPDSENTWIMLAGCYQRSNDLGHTILTYSDFLKRFPKSTMVPKVNETLALLYAQLGLQYAKQGKADEAIKELQDAIKLNPTLDAPWLTLGGVYQATGQIAEAIKVYEEFNVKFKNHAMSGQVRGLLDALKKERSRISNKVKGDEMLRFAAPGTTGNGNTGAVAAVPAPEDGSSDPSKNANSKKPDGRDDYLAFMVQSGTGGFQRWPKSRIPITVFIHDGSKIPGYRPAFARILQSSFDDWGKASGGNVTFTFVDSPSIALFHVYWTDKLSDLKNAAEAGDARVFIDQQYISKAEVWFLTKPTAMPLTDNGFRHVALHEIGHALGLSGHTTNPEDVMFYSATFKDVWRDLSGRDSRSITRLYQNDI